MTPRTLLAFDYGEKYIGVAVGSTGTGLAQGLATVRNMRTGPDWRRIGALVEEWQPDALVVGLPLNMDGSENPRTRAARRFGQHLQDRYNLPVFRVDERLSTQAAKASLETGKGRLRKETIDKRAARMILQDFLDHPSDAGLEY